MVGTCTITVTEADHGLSGTTVITQAANNTVTLSTGGTTAAPHTLPQSSGTTPDPTTITVTVKNPAGTGVSGVALNFTTTANTANGCGTLGATTGTTGAGGTTTVVYDAAYSPFTGICTITATEAAAGTGESAPQSGTSVIATTSAPLATNTVVTTDTTATPAPGAKDTVTATVTGAASASDPVLLTATGTCGTFNTTSGTTPATGTAAVAFTYTAGATAGACSIVAVEANSGSAAAPVTITTTVPTANSVAVTAAPTSVVDDGTSTSTITATVTGPTSAPVSGDDVGFAGTGTCGAIAPTGGVTNASGVVSVTYTSATTTGFCNITVTELGTGSTGTVQIDNIA